MSILSLFAQNYYNDPYMYSTGSSSASDAAATAAIISLVLFGLLFVAVVYVVQSLLLGKIFAKAGEKSWKAWVPVYNNWTLLELGDQQGIWAILAFIPVVNIVAAVFMYIAMYTIGLKLGKEGAFVLLAIFLPIVWFVWLAVDKSTWHNKVPAAKTA